MKNQGHTNSKLRKNEENKSRASFLNVFFFLLRWRGGVHSYGDFECGVAMTTEFCTYECYNHACWYFSCGLSNTYLYMVKPL